MRILSLGAGVQSTTLLLMMHEGDIPTVDVALFADTQWEPSHVYTHLNWLTDTVSIPVERVTAGSLHDDALAGKPEAWLPLYIRNQEGKPGALRRQCTSHYKIAPLRRRVRALMTERGEKRAEMVIGISLDEAHRMRDPDVKYLHHEYPLVDLRLTRGDCMAWLERHGYPIPKKSACIACPFRNNHDWRALKAEPQEWEAAVAFDRLSCAVRGLISKAKRRRIHVHFGRVNSQARLDLVARAGCDSADGTYTKHGPEQNLPRGYEWLDALNGAPR